MVVGSIGLIGLDFLDLEDYSKFAGYGNRKNQKEVSGSENWVNRERATMYSPACCARRIDFVTLKRQKMAWAVPRWGRREAEGTGVPQRSRG